MPTATRIENPVGPVLFDRQIFADDRGVFLEDYHEERYRDLGFSARFVQTNRSSSREGVLRGMHFQHPGAQGKLVSVTRGAVFDVAVDIRVESPTFGRWYGVELSDENGRQLWVPPDFAHGFVALTEWADLLYHCTDFYDPACELTLAWDDPTVGIDWPVRNPILSPKDLEGVRLDDLSAAERLPHWLESAEPAGA